MKKFVAYITLGLFTIYTSCTDPYALQTNTFEDLLVIEATITNELKKQEIKVTRTFQLEEKEPVFETNATVYVTDDLGNQFNFVEENEKYISEFEFQAAPDRQYQLFVSTANGKEYTSTKEKLTTVNNLTSIEATVKNKFGVNGVDLTANSFDPTETSKYYRYEYEETYRFSVPYWSIDSLTIDPDYVPYIFYIEERTEESKKCFITEKSTDIILENTTSYSQDKVSDFSVRFIDQSNFIIADRYSILVKQYIQSLEAYNYYLTLKKISYSGSVLSPNQPGFVNGNITNVKNKNEKVIGFFDISSVSEKRIFFNYTDLFPGEPLPSYFYECKIQEFDENGNDALGNRFLAVLTKQGTITLYQNFKPFYIMVTSECGDCRVLGSNVVPSFWE